MTREAMITCDKCGQDLTYTGNSEDWRIVLASQAKMPWYVREGLPGGAVTDVAIPDPVPRSLHFCGWLCLESWFDERCKRRNGKRDE